jgi:hypothetical protein
MMSPSIWAAIENLHAQLRQMSAVRALWTDDALARAPEWVQVRTDARSILAELGQPAMLPPLTWLHYVPGMRDRH